MKSCARARGAGRWLTAAYFLAAVWGVALAMEPPLAARLLGGAVALAALFMIGFAMYAVDRPRGRFRRRVGVYERLLTLAHHGSPD
ncbi:MAG: hypothetical protein K6U79_06735 [Firmicutes bacterium]|nr:hypothetical protein [Bacillota bacterium]